MARILDQNGIELLDPDGVQILDQDGDDEDDGGSVAPSQPAVTGVRPLWPQPPEPSAVAPTPLPTWSRR